MCTSTVSAAVDAASPGARSGTAIGATRNSRRATIDETAAMAHSSGQPARSRSASVFDERNGIKTNPSGSMRNAVAICGNVPPA